MEKTFEEWFKLHNLDGVWTLEEEDAFLGMARTAETPDQIQKTIGQAALMMAEMPDEQMEDLIHRVLDTLGLESVLQAKAALSDEEFQAVVPVLLKLAKEANFDDLEMLAIAVSGENLASVLRTMMKMAETIDHWERIYDLADIGSPEEKEAEAKLDELDNSQE